MKTGNQRLQLIEGRNAVSEALRAGKAVSKLYVQEQLRDEVLLKILREAEKQGIRTERVSKDALQKMSETGMPQGVIAEIPALRYSDVREILDIAREKNEAPFILLLDGIQDPHNLGAIIRTANLSGAHGVIIPKNRSAGLTAAVFRTSAGALSYTPVAQVTNLARTMEELKKEGLWFVCADMGGKPYFELDFKGPLGLVIGNEGDGVSRLVREKCDFTASIPMKGDIDSLNASVAAGILAFEAVRQRMQ